MRTILVADAIDDGDALWVAGELTAEDERVEVFLLPSDWIGDQDPVEAIDEAMKLFDAEMILVASYSAAGCAAITRALALGPVPTGHVVVEPRCEALLAA
jgi:hypothetical protein